jgi:hypothetical protein
MVEQQTNSKFCCRLRKTGTETHKMLETVYWSGVETHMHVFRYFKRLGEGL